MIVNQDKCNSCGRSKGENHKATVPRPSIEQLQEWISDCVCESTDGCITEPDGICEHGHLSWLRQLGFI